MAHLKAPTPPRWAQRLLQWRCPKDQFEELEGDLEELFHGWVEADGLAKARWQYGLHVLGFLRPIPWRQPAARHPSHFNPLLTPNPFDMLRNYLTIALRTLSRNKLYSTLNVAGLTFGLTCFLLIGLYLFDELTFDQQHGNAHRIYRVVEHKNVKGQATSIAAGSYKLAEESGKSIAEIEQTTRVARIGRANLINPEHPVNFQETITVANEHFLQIFDFPLLLGDKTTALREPNSIIINEDLALRLFNSTQVLGKTLRFNFMESSLKVTGVLKNHPRNSSFDFNSVVSEASFWTTDADRQELDSDWSSTGFSVYVLLKPNANPEAVSTKLTKLILAHHQPETGTRLSFGLQALTDMHLHSEGITDGARNSNVEAMAQGSPFYIRSSRSLRFSSWALPASIT
jgi:putative ABC transport system permease protein